MDSIVVDISNWKESELEDAAPDGPDKCQKKAGSATPEFPGECHQGEPSNEAHKSDGDKEYAEQLAASGDKGWNL